MVASHLSGEQGRHVRPLKLFFSLAGVYMFLLTRFPVVYTVLLHLVSYAYLGVGYFAFYARPTRSGTAARFAAFAVADLLVTYLCTGALMLAVAASVLLW